MDRKAESYYSISPYAFTLNNPIRYFDPNGEDVWEIDANGNMNRVLESEQHWLFLVDNKGNRVFQDNQMVGIRVEDGSIFEQLSQVQFSRPEIDAEGNVLNMLDTRWAHGGDGSGMDMANTFVFLAGNTNNEWSLSYGVTGQGEGIYGIRTTGYKGSVTTALTEVPGVNIMGNIHSHPAKQLGVGTNAEHYSMGSDRRNMGASNHPFSNGYVYMGTSGNVWQNVRTGPNSAVSNNLGRQTPAQINRRLRR